jgi:hypothetical protein
MIFIYIQLADGVGQIAKGPFFLRFKANLKTHHFRVEIVPVIVFPLLPTVSTRVFKALSR